jgi:hypothetical protein
MTSIAGGVSPLHGGSAELFDFQTCLAMLSNANRGSDVSQVSKHGMESAINTLFITQ